MEAGGGGEGGGPVPPGPPGGEEAGMGGMQADGGVNLAGTMKREGEERVPQEEAGLSVDVNEDEGKEEFSV